MRHAIIASFLLLLTLVSFRSALQFKINGKVKDERGSPIANVLVREKGTNNNAFTDIHGDFDITVNNENAKLEFVMTGFETALHTVPANGAMLIILKAGVDVAKDKKEEERLMSPLTGAVTGVALSEVVVMGYGQVSKKAMVNKQSSPSGIYSQSALTTSRGTNKNPDRNYNTEDYDAISENRFLAVAENPLSTFSIDVDAASYSNIRRYIQNQQLPPAGSVRIEEMINYFHYEYPQPLGDDPFSINTEIASCPWNTNHQLILVGLQGKKIPMESLPPSNIVFLIDVSGSMMSENKLPLVRSSMKLLVDQLREQDKVSIVVYAGNAGLVLSPTSGSEKIKIKDAIDKLEAGGSTAGGEGIKLAYKTAINNFITNGNNRVILCTDGDFNVGVSSDAELERLIEDERKSGVFLTVLGYGMGNYKDNKMQKLADKGNGNHAYIDGMSEAKKVLVNEFGGTLFTIAKDVKLQVEFNPAKVQSYRLIGYENRLLAKEDFNNDKKDAGELGSGHTVTALYEVIPSGAQNEFSQTVDPLKYQEPVKQRNWAAAKNGELMNIKFRYKKPDGDVSKLIEHAVKESQSGYSNTSDNFRFAAAVAEFGMLLNNSEFKQSSSMENALQLAKKAVGKDGEGYRNEFLQLVKSAQSLVKEESKSDEEKGSVQLIKRK